MLETGCAIHHSYGIPYVMGSSAKGAVNAYVRGTEFGQAASIGVEPFAPDLHLLEPRIQRLRLLGESPLQEGVQAFAPVVGIALHHQTVDQLRDGLGHGQLAHHQARHEPRRALEDVRCRCPGATPADVEPDRPAGVRRGGTS